MMQMVPGGRGGGRGVEGGRHPPGHVIRAIGAFGHLAQRKKALGRRWFCPSHFLVSCASLARYDAWRGWGQLVAY
eukprot:COSAG02_NODE_5806_length_4023_cov_5.908002_1_plen_75_part_00